MPNAAVTNFFQKRVANPLMRRKPIQTLLETTGRKSGEPRRTPLGGASSSANQFWFVSEFGEKSQYVPQHPGQPASAGAVAGQVAQRHRASDARRRPTRTPSRPVAAQQLRRAHLRHEPADRARRPDRLATESPLTSGPIEDKSKSDFSFTSAPTHVDGDEPWNRSFTCEKARPRDGCTPTSTASRTTNSAAAGSPAAPPTCTAATTPPHTASVGPAAARRRAVQRAQAERRHRRQRRPDADVLQRRLPGAAVPPNRADAVLRALRRR